MSNLVFYTVFFSIPVYLGEIRDSSDLVIAGMLFLTSLISGLCSPFAGGVAERFGASRPVITSGAALCVAAAFLALALGARCR